MNGGIADTLSPEAALVLVTLLLLGGAWLVGPARTADR
jgi:hypothetical protein